VPEGKGLCCRPRETDNGRLLSRVVWRYRNKTWLELKALYGSLMTSPVYFGFVGVILLSSSLLAFS
jgi:hypothetical protein